MYAMHESKTLEFKESISKSFLKTVSAFSNYNGGVIIFGIDDNGKIVGIQNPTASCLDIENRINDNISPQPNYTIVINKKDQTITLTINEGNEKPYFYNSKAYKRNDTSTIEVDSFELKRLILEGKNINYEQLSSTNQNLSFNFLEKKLIEHINLKAFNQDTLKTLNLYSEEYGFNNAANILSDENTFPSVDIAKFGDTINIIKKRLLLENMSILEIFDRAVKMYRDYYQYEKIDGSLRTVEELIPEEAFREALANALIHRQWDINAKVRISMFDDRIEISSPGGLPKGITEKEYLNGNISLQRNPIISNIFYRLGIVEVFGTGILRINYSYKNSVKKPLFTITTNTISINLPITKNNINLSEDEAKVFMVLSETKPLSISQIEPLVPFGRSKIKIILKKMEQEGIIKIIGNGKSTKYRL